MAADADCSRRRRQGYERFDMTHVSGRCRQNHTGGGSQQSLPSRPNSSSIIHLHAAAAATVRISVMTRCRRTHRQRRMTRRSVSRCCRRSAMPANRSEVVSSLALRFISDASDASEAPRCFVVLCCSDLALFVLPSRRGVFRFCSI